MAQYPQGIFQSLQYLLKKVKILALQKQPTYSNISLNSSVTSYTMPGRGIYEIIAANSIAFPIIFPNPALCNGQTITVINTDTISSQVVSEINQPLQYGNTNPLTIIPAASYIILVSINGVWRAVSLS